MSFTFGACLDGTGCAFSSHILVCYELIRGGKSFKCEADIKALVTVKGS